ncbi:MAG: MotA/TolQ/ExbB proton channel family protein [uncultured Gemmatimonadetes bacterium]|uniref:MotA/TolQ/ExbB proton channel family protein n=1 Tax=uncultured Gemmatimonadota bacterium TaxID=203437 RepID=A0A6J4MUX2_9BACT|nr:MAG: MotA/TolQ/ExbB proton channel family protein [uncultured Gemmatimonadota bacterium]
MIIQTQHSEFAIAWEMVAEGTASTKIIMAVLAILSLASWAVIVWKIMQFRRFRAESDSFMRRVGGAETTDEAFHAVSMMDATPFTRLFQRGLGFFREMRPGAARAGSELRGLSPAQLEVLRMVLEKEEGEERDDAARGVGWLAIVATVSPLLGLLGTVLGVMTSFIGVAQAGSSSIDAVAPGVAEALLTTAGGLVVAIPAAMAYNYLTGKLNDFMGEMEGISSELIATLAREGRI